MSTCVFGASSLRRRTQWTPSMPGRLMSMNTTLGCIRGISRKASSAFPYSPTQITPGPRFKIPARLLRTSASSSTTATVIKSSSIFDISWLPERQDQPHGSPAAGPALLREAAAELLHSLLHVGQAITHHTNACHSDCFCVAGFSIILDKQCQHAGVELQAEPDLACSRMLNDVVQ